MDSEVDCLVVSHRRRHSVAGSGQNCSSVSSKVGTHRSRGAKQSVTVCDSSMCLSTMNRLCCV